MKLTVIVGLCFVFSSFGAVFSKQCYSCESTKSLDDCMNKPQTLTTCTSDGEKCFQFELVATNGSSEEHYAGKGCSQAERCEEYKVDQGKAQCKSIAGERTVTKCLGLCCDGDKCNKEDLNSGHTVIAASVSLPVLVSFWCLLFSLRN